ncbi:MAG: nitroreductase family protein [Selenomonadaceae bacterium]|nr:nitroreductase family protein [Selenomonadaceae bacterium]
MKNFLELAKERYSCRKLTDKPIEAEKIERILQAAISAPTAKNIQPYKIWKISSAEGIEKVKQTTNFTFGAGLILAVGVDMKKSFVRPFDEMNFGLIDGSIIATHIWLAVQDEGLGTTWVGWFDAPKLQELIPEMKNYEMIALFPIGYPAEDAKPSNRHEDRREISEVVTEI